MDIGINLEGANSAPPTHQEIDYYAAKGFTYIRLPLEWETLQPQLDGSLNSTLIAQVHDAVNYAASQGMKILIDIHSFGSYNGNLIGSSQVPDSAFTDLWSKLAQEFKSSPNVLFDLMNEPQLPTAASWLTAANGAIAAIRAAGATQQILVSGAYWDGGASWTTTDNASVIGTPGAVVDPLNNYAFEVHQYLDDGSGQNDWVVSPTIGVDRLQAVTAWARANHVKMFLGEFGVADNAPSLTAMTNMLNFVAANQDVWEGATYWAGGLTWHGYMYSAEPELGLIDTAQMGVLEDYANEHVSMTALGNGQIEADTFVTGHSTPSIKDILDASSNLLSRTLYDSAGNLERVLVKNQDGSFTITAYDTTTHKVTTVDDYDASQTQLDHRVWASDGSSVTTGYASDGYPTDHIYYNTSGVETQATQHLENSTSAVVKTYTNGVLSLVETETQNGSNWPVVDSKTYNTAGIETAHTAFNTDGTQTVEAFNATTGVIQTRADYAAGGAQTSLINFDSTGHETQLTKFLSGGGKEIDLFHSGDTTAYRVQTLDSHGTILTDIDSTLSSSGGSNSGSSGGSSPPSAPSTPDPSSGGSSSSSGSGSSSSGGGVSSGASAAPSGGDGLVITGTDQPQHIDGQATSDQITGGSGNESVRGMDGNDTIDGGGGDDDVNGNKGADIVHGGTGNDTVRGGQDNDTVYGDDGDDGHVNGNLGDDVVHGGNGNDYCYGGQGNDSVFGDDGNDTLSGDLGNDTLTGGAGADLFTFAANSGHDIIMDFNSAEGDRISLAPGLTYNLAMVGGHVEIQLGDGSTIDLMGVTSTASMGTWLAA